MSEGVDRSGQIWYLLSIRVAAQAFVVIGYGELPLGENSAFFSLVLKIVFLLCDTGILAWIIAEVIKIRAGKE